MMLKTALLMAIFIASCMTTINADLDLGISRAYTGERATVTVTINNWGHTIQRDVTVTINTPEEIGGKISETITAIPAQTTIEKKYFIIIPPEAEPGNYPVQAVIGYAEDKQIVKTSNLNILPFPAELTARIHPPSVDKKQEASVYVTLRNIGTEDLKNVRILIEAQPFVELERAELPVGILAIAQETSKEFKLTAPNTPGEHPVIVKVEFEDSTGQHTVLRTVNLRVKRGFSTFSAVLAILITLAILLIYLKFRG